MQSHRTLYVYNEKMEAMAVLDTEAVWSFS